MNINYIFLLIVGVATSEDQLLRIPLVRHKSVLGKMLESNTHKKHLKKIFQSNSPLFEAKHTNDTIQIYKVLQSQYYGEIFIGSPGQKFKMGLDTSSEYTWVPSSSCSPFVYPACAIRNKYDSQKSTTYVDLGKNYTLPTDKGNLFGFLAKEKFHLGHINVQNQSFLEIESMSYIQLLYSGYDGVLGLGFDKNPVDSIEPIIQTLFRQYTDIQPIFSFYMNRDETTSKGGSLFIGGADKNHYKGEFTYLPLINTQYWTFKMNKVSINYVLPYRNTTAEVCTSGCVAFPSPGDVLISGPKEDIKIINRLLEANYVPYLDRYEVSCDKIHKLPTVTFYLNGKPFPIKGRHYVEKLSYGPLTLCLSAFTELKNTPPNFWALGVSFMGQYYVKFNMNLKRIGIAELKT